jgi:hypothetical protein
MFEKSAHSIFCQWKCLQEEVTREWEREEREKERVRERRERERESSVLGSAKSLWQRVLQGILTDGEGSVQFTSFY